MISYRKADISDIDFLTFSRINVLIAANKLPLDTPMQHIEKQTRAYYEAALPCEEHVAYLVFDDDRWIASGGISFYQVMPTYHNPTGRKAYIMNMYTHPEYRRRGIASHILQLLTQEAYRKGITCVTLEATEEGFPVYQKFGFVRMENEMELTV